MVLTTNDINCLERISRESSLSDSHGNNFDFKMKCLGGILFRNTSAPYRGRFFSLMKRSANGGEGVFFSIASLHLLCRLFIEHCFFLRMNRGKKKDVWELNSSIDCAER
ncbi:hypothetical protein CDAR_271891 [Caerostris darwini]|uniref:Uncharacterized protein n=1 Tax=Caerostris darwini TaxID=1538125 RepID=A0AAV4W947_9ARAC|nr:hypothetical protein CDAR_271891 [Caerostris darwini]